ncbi:MAG: PIN domain-containing protein [Actinomycetota bacterium]
MIAIDTNVLVYAHRDSSPLFDEATKSLRDLFEGKESFCIPVFVVNEFVKVVSSPHAFHPPTPTRLALASIESLLLSEYGSIIYPGPRYFSILQSLIEEVVVSSDMIFDAAIAAVCREHGVNEILTEDRRFAIFERPKIKRLQRKV